MFGRLSRAFLLFAPFVWGFVLSTASSQEQPSSAEGATGNQSSTSPELAQPLGNFRQLKNGMTYQDVIKTLGAPAERKEFESRREVVWIYGADKIFFKEGKTFAWTNSGRSISEGLASSSARSYFVAKPAEDESVKKILGEILDDRAPTKDLPEVQTPAPTNSQ